MANKKTSCYCCESIDKWQNDNKIELQELDTFMKHNHSPHPTLEEWKTMKIRRLEMENKQLKEENQVITLGNDVLNDLVGKYANEIECLKEVIYQYRKRLKSEN